MSILLEQRTYTSKIQCEQCGKIYIVTPLQGFKCVGCENDEISCDTAKPSESLVKTETDNLPNLNSE